MNLLTLRNILLIFAIILPSETSRSKNEDAELLKKAINVKETTAAPTHTSKRIVRGFACSTKQYPFMVVISKRNELLTRHCSGSLLSSRYVLTAAHCLGRYPLVVVAGVNSPKGKSIESNVVKQIQHPRWSRHNYQNDIALLVVANPIAQSEYIKYVNIPSGEFRTSYLETKCHMSIAMSWEETVNPESSNDKPSSFVLQCAVLPMIGYQQCKSMQRTYEVFDTNICALPNEGHDTCQEDSGGPLLCGTLQIGIVSWGVACGESFNPGLYTRVDKYLSFIHSFVPKPRGKNDPSSEDLTAYYDDENYFNHSSSYLNQYMYIFSIVIVLTMGML